MGTLPNPNLPVTEERLQEFYNMIKPYLGLREMPSGDISEIVSPLPSTRKGYHRYSTEEQIVGEWIDGKPIYEKTVEISGTWGASGETTLAYIDEDTTHKWKSVDVYDGNIGAGLPSLAFGNITVGSTTVKGIVQFSKYVGGDNGKLCVKLQNINGSASGTWNGIAIIQYTKTTD